MPVHVLAVSGQKLLFLIDGRLWNASLPCESCCCFPSILAFFWQLAAKTVEIQRLQCGGGKQWA
jgi:hypothetical protein